MYTWLYKYFQNFVIYNKKNSSENSAKLLPNNQSLSEIVEILLVLYSSHIIVVFSILLPLKFPFE